MRLIALVFLSGSALAWAQAPAAAPPASNDSSSKLQTQLTKDEAILKDWPDLARYRDENAKVQPPAAGEARVVFMGDSITDSWGRNYGQFFPGKPYLNRGISGQTTPQMLVRFRPDVINLQPKAVVILAGTNDISGNTGPMTNEEIQANLASMSELADAHKIKVVLSSITPVSEYHVEELRKRQPGPWSASRR